MWDDVRSPRAREPLASVSSISFSHGGAAWGTRPTSMCYCDNVLRRGPEQIGLLDDDIVASPPVESIQSRTAR